MERLVVETPPISTFTFFPLEDRVWLGQQLLFLQKEAISSSTNARECVEGVDKERKTKGEAQKALCEKSAEIEKL